MTSIDLSLRRKTTAPPVVRVNGVEITREAIGRETQHHPATHAAKAREQAARALVIRELLVQEARRRGIKAAAETDEDGRIETADEAAVRALLTQAGSVPVVDDTSCRRYYEAHRQQFRTADLHEVAHILIAADPADDKARAGARAQAEGLLEQLLEAGGAQTFASTARAFSACPSSAQGGQLGQIGPGQTVPEFEKALSSMEEGKVHREPIETRYGFHIVFLARRVRGRQLSFEEAHRWIADFLADRAERTALKMFVQHLAAGANIEGIDLGGAPSSASLS